MKSRSTDLENKGLRPPRFTTFKPGKMTSPFARFESSKPWQKNALIFHGIPGISSIVTFLLGKMFNSLKVKSLGLFFT